MPFLILAHRKQINEQRRSLDVLECHEGWSHTKEREFKKIRKELIARGMSPDSLKVVYFYDPVHIGDTIMDKSPLEGSWTNAYARNRRVVMARYNETFSRARRQSRDPRSLGRYERMDDLFVR